jgi:hypothetical protein
MEYRGIPQNSKEFHVIEILIPTEVKKYGSKKSGVKSTPTEIHGHLIVMRKFACMMRKLGEVSTWLMYTHILYILYIVPLKLKLLPSP